MVLHFLMLLTASAWGSNGTGARVEAFSLADWAEGLKSTGVRQVLHADLWEI